MAKPFNLTARINLQGPYNLRPIVSKIKKDIGSIKPELKFKLDPAAAKSVKAITAEIKKLDAATKGVQKTVTSLNQQLSSLSASFNATASATRTATNATSSVTKATSQAAKSAKEARTAVEEFGRQSGLAIKRFAAFSSVTAVIYGVTNAITSAYKEFLIFNREIIRLSQVTNRSVSDLSDITKEITRLSTSIGATSSDLITVASTLAQAGLSAEDTKIALEALAKTTLAPSFENITDTTEGAIAAMRQFGIQSSELDSALGSINAVAAAFAVEASDIIAAIQRTGGVFASASRGVSEGTDALNEFIAIFTSVRQTTRESAETIATGLRTIFTRIQRSATIDLLKQYGIELRDLEGKFVGGYEAVRRLSEGLSRIDPRSADFARISEELGGFRQIGKVIPLLQEFAVAQQALNVAQKGSGSLAKDVATAQQSLIVQFTKTRENFVSLIREIGDSASFRVFTDSVFFLTNSLVDLGRTLKPLLPLLLTFATIKIGTSLPKALSGFGTVFGLGGGGGGTSPGGAGGGGGGGRGGGGNQPLTSALTLSTAATNTLVQTITALNTSALALNQNIVNTNSLLLNRPTRGFATGGLVPGKGNSDTVRANLTPGEFVLRKSAVEAIGVDNLARMNRGGEAVYANGGKIPRFAEAGPVDPSRLSIEQLKNLLYGIDQPEGVQKGIPRTVAGIYKPVVPVDLSRVDYTKSAKVLSDISRDTGIDINKLQALAKFVQEKKETAKIQTVQEKEAEKQANIAEKNDLLKAGVLRFGLAGLKYGTTAGSTSTLAGRIGIGDIGSSFTGREAIRQTKDGIPIQVMTGALSNEFNKVFAKRIEDGLRSSFTNTVGETAQFLGRQIGSGIISNPAEIKKRIDNAGFSSVVGSALEGAISLIEGTPFFAKEEKTKSIDFPLGLSGSASKLFNLPPGIPTDITRTIGSPGKGITDYILQINRFLDTPEGLAYLSKSPRVRKAAGGSISGKDTVPALLTPGEFVFNKESAERIGYGTLNRMNKVKGYNKGGIVGPQKFARGGLVSDPAVIIGGLAAASNVLVQEIERMAGSFSKLDGQLGVFGAGFSGLITEFTSSLASSIIALKTVGVKSDSTLFRATTAGAAIGGGISGLISETSAKLMSKALQKNTEALGSFNAALKKVNEATTEQARSEAATQLDAAFIKLQTSIQNNISNIDSMENWQKVGESGSRLTSTITSIIVGMVALNSATRNYQRQLRVNALRQTAGKAPNAIGTLVTIAGTIGKLATGIGIAITTVSVLIEAFTFFTNRLTKSADQLDKLGQGAEENIKRSKDFALTNETFVKQLLPQFETLRKAATGPQATEAGKRAFEQALGGISAEPQGLKSSELNLLGRQIAKGRLAAAGIPLGQGETLRELESRLGGQDLDKFNKALADAAIGIREIFFIRAKVAEGLTPEEARNFRQTLTPEEVTRVTRQYIIEQNKLSVTQKSYEYALSKVRISILKLENVMIRVTNSIERSSLNAVAALDNFDARLAVGAGQPATLSSAFVKNLSDRLTNVATMTNEDFRQLDTTLKGMIGSRVQGSVIDTETNKKLIELTDRIRATAIIQEELPDVLRFISERRRPEEIGEVLKPVREQLSKSINDTAIIDNILRELESGISNALEGVGGGKKFETVSDLISNDPAVKAIFDAGAKSADDVKKILDSYGKVVDRVGQSQKQAIEIQTKLNELLLQEVSIRSQSSIELKQALGQEISLREKNVGFNESIDTLLSQANKTGLTQIQPGANVETIANELRNLQLIAQARFVQSQQPENIATGTAQIFLQQLDSLNLAINPLRSAMKMLADDGSRAANTLEEIGKQRERLKSREDKFIDMLDMMSDPLRALELENIVNAVKAVEAGTARLDQARLARSQGTEFIRAIRGDEQARNFERRATALIVGGLKPFITTRGQAEGAALLQRDLNEEAIVGPLRNLFKFFTGQRLEATGLFAKEEESKLSTTLQNTQTIFDTFNTEISNILGVSILKTKELENRLQSGITGFGTISKPFTRQELNLRRGLGPSDVGPFGGSVAITPFGGVPLPSNGLENKDLRKFGLKDVEARLSSASTAEAQLSILKGYESELRKRFQLADYLIKTGRTNIGGIMALPPSDGQPGRPLSSMNIGAELEARTFIENLMRAIQEVQNRVLQPQQTPPQLRPTRTGARMMEGASLTPRAIDSFSTSANQLASALTGDNNNINQLVTAVNSLGTFANNLQGITNQLAGLFRDGRLQIDQQTNAKVDVSFDTGLILERDATLDSALVDRVNNLVEEKLSNKFSNFMRELRTG